MNDNKKIILIVDDTDNGKVIQFTISEVIAKSTHETLSLDALYKAKGRGRNKVIFR
ncbi:hypothetical protein JHD48_04260 [Sulfurimonas sp. SAG-AH-194-I05]|nr:hypothetical protein [Sulfurimonas sp. SAG-AH-194-I05]MDF1874942.1 hypothetical protein [Sulfurimonas sp. SAG-AH-194-I05]